VRLGAKMILAFVAGVIGIVLLTTLTASENPESMRSSCVVLTNGAESCP
jgi:hypothetical protein